MRRSHNRGTNARPGRNCLAVRDSNAAALDTHPNFASNAATDGRPHGIACSDAGTNRDSCRPADVNAAANLRPCHTSADANAER